MANKCGMFVSLETEIDNRYVYGKKYCNYSVLDKSKKFYNMLVQIYCEEIDNFFYIVSLFSDGTDIIKSSIENELEYETDKV